VVCAVNGGNDDDDDDDDVDGDEVAVVDRAVSFGVRGGRRAARGEARGDDELTTAVTMSFTPSLCYQQRSKVGGTQRDQTLTILLYLNSNLDLSTKTMSLLGYPMFERFGIICF